MATIGKHLAEIETQAGPLIRLYCVDGVYRLRMGSGIGWLPDEFPTYEAGLKKLLACQSFGNAHIEMCARIGKVDHKKPEKVLQSKQKRR